MQQYSIKDKTIASVSYMSFGIFGFIALLLGAVNSHFLRFHVFQSILLGLLYILITNGLSILIRFFLIIASALKISIGNLPALYAKANEFMLYAVVALFVYCIIQLWREQYSWVKYISPQIYKMV